MKNATKKKEEFENKVKRTRVDESNAAASGQEGVSSGSANGKQGTSSSSSSVPQGDTTSHDHVGAQPRGG